MASEKDSSCQNLCANDPNFAIICSFFDRFASSCGINPPTFLELQEMIESPLDVPHDLIDLHVKLLRKIRKSVATEKWERALIKFCHSYWCSEDGWELERCGYKKCKVPVKLRILKTLLDAQFDLNPKFKTDINKLTAEELRIEPLGRDKVGQSYWCQFDSAANVRVYKEDQDEETWKLVAKDREGLVELITQLSSGEELLGLELINEDNEDSNSQEVEKPIIDTGQIQASTSEDNTADNTSSINFKIENEDKQEDLPNTEAYIKEIKGVESKTGNILKPENPELVMNGKANIEETVISVKDLQPPVPDDKISPNEGEVNDNSKELSHSVVENAQQDSSSITVKSENSNSNEKAEDDNALKSNPPCNTEKEIETEGTEAIEGDVDENSAINKCNEMKSNVDVTEEIKQRSLFKSNSISLFKGKTGKSSSGSKLDQIFSRKLEQGNSGSSAQHCSKTSANVLDCSVQNPQRNQPNSTCSIQKDEPCSEILVQKDEKKDSDLFCNEDTNKRKPQEMDDKPSKKKCVEQEPDDEVGEEIEEPVMIIKGEGSGQDCDTGNPGKESEEGVSTAENLNNGNSCKDDINVANKQNQNPSKYEFKNFEKLNDNLNNGLLDNSEENKELFDKESKTEANQETKNEICSAESGNVSKEEEIYDGKRSESMKDRLVEENPFPPAIANSSDENVNNISSNTEHEKSIEEQLSALTGESFDEDEPSLKIDNSNKSDSLMSNKNKEKGVRRKSFDCTDSDDNDTIPPEAKKTKVREDSLDIFGSIDETQTHSDEKNKHLLVEDQKHVCDAPKPLKIIKHDKITDGGDKETSLNSVEKQVNDRVVLNEDISPKETEDSDKVVETDEGDFVNDNDSKQNSTDNKTFQTCPLKTSKNSLDIQALNINNTSTLNTTKTLLKNTCEDNLKPKIGDKELANSLDDKSEKVDENKVMNKNNQVEVVSKLEKDSIEADSEKEGPLSVHASGIDDTENSLANIEEKAKLTPEGIDMSRENKSEEVATDITISVTDSHVENKSVDPINKSETEEKQDSSLLKSESAAAIGKKKPAAKKSPKPRRKVFTPKSRKRNRNKESNSSKALEENALVEQEKEKSRKSSLEDPLDESLPDQKNTPENKEEQTETKEVTKEVLENNESKPAPIKNRKRRSSRRNTGTEKDSEEDIVSGKTENTETGQEEIGGKRRKIKGKRALNKTIRKSVEEKRNSKSSSEEDAAHQDSSEEKPSKKSPGSKKQKSPTKSSHAASKSKSKQTVISKKKNESTETNDETEEPVHAVKKSKGPKSLGRNSRAFLGIDLNIDLNETSRSVRQSSRLAQIKIKEQADHKHGDDNIKHIEKSPTKSKKKKDENEEKLKGTPKKKKKLKKAISEDEAVEEEAASEKKKGKKKRKKKNPVKAFNERDPWKSSSGSSSENEEEEEEDHFDEIAEEEEYLPVNLKSDHEFSPESDLEGDDEVRPIRHARTAQKISEPSAEYREESKDFDDFACEKCGKKDHPEWILLCDTCDHGWHASCLRPSLMLVPEGDWHCPSCQHVVLIKRLQETLKVYDRDTKRRENEELRKKRLAYVGISLDNVLPSQSHGQGPREREWGSRAGSGSESSESSVSGSESASEESDEPVYQLRQRRQGTTSYRFNEFDELINSAIQDEVEGTAAAIVATAPKPTEVLNKEGEEMKSDATGAAENNVDALQKKENKDITSTDDQSKVEKEEKPKKKVKNESDESSDKEDENDDDEEEEEEFPRVVPKRNNILPRPGKKKHRRLNCLDDASDDDDGSDEDFKGSSSDEEEEDEDEDDTDDSEIGRRGRSKRGHLGPVRRSSRTRRSRFDKEFINDNSDESDAPRRKKTKKLWSDSDSESDDSTWGRRKKKKNYSSSSRRKFKKNKKFTIEDELSDIETSKVPKKKRQRKIKYGGLDELAVEDLPSRRTRGKKINYQEVIGTDSDEEIQKPKSLKRPIIEDDDDEFVAEKEEEKEESSGSSTDEEDEPDNEEKSSDDERKKVEVKSQEKEEIEELTPKPDIPPIKVSPPKPMAKEKPVPGRRGRPPKAMIAPPPERLISEDEKYKAIVSKVSTLSHSNTIGSDKCEISLVKSASHNDQSNGSCEGKDYIDPAHHLTPIKIQNSSFDSKFLNRSPPIKIRSGVPVNAGGRKSPALGSPTSENAFFPTKPHNLGMVHSPPEKLQFPLQMQRTLVPIQASAQSFVTARKSINPAFPVIKSENICNSDELDDLDDEDLMDDIEEEEEEEEDDENESDEDILEEGEIPKKVAKRMARMEERMQRLEEKRLAKQVKGAPPGSVQPSSPGSGPPIVNPPGEQKPPTTQPSQPLLRVVSPLKLMANPPGPLQSSFMHSAMAPRLPMSSPQPTRLPMPMRPAQPANMMPGMPIDDSSAKRRGRGRGKKPGQEKPEQEMISGGGGSVIRGMLQQPQAYPPSHYPQSYPPHMRMPFNAQRMPRPPFHPGHHPLDPSPSGGGTVTVKQEPKSHPPSNPVHIPNQPPTSNAPAYHPPPPPHRFDSGHPRQINYPPQSNPPPKAQYGSFPPPSTPSANYHYGSYPPPIPSREEHQVYPVQQPCNEQFADPPAVPVVTPSNKGFAEEDSGEFGGLVSYFSSQREDDIDT